MIVHQKDDDWQSAAHHLGHLPRRELKGANRARLMGVRQQLRLHIGDDLQASGADLMTYHPRTGRMCRRGPDNIGRTTHYLAAEALAEFDTRELATRVTAAFHDDNSRNAASVSLSVL